MEKNKKSFIRNIAIAIGVSCLFFSILTALYIRHREKSLLKQIDRYISMVYSIERSFIENIPTYEDYISQQKIRKLRKYLLPYHLKEASRYGTGPIRSENDLENMKKDERVVKLGEGKEVLYYFYNVNKKYRYLLPEASDGLRRLTERYQENLNRRTKLPPVKIAVSSALRPRIYQKNLQIKNFNATDESSHYYGCSFDIFFDDYYIKLPDGMFSGSTYLSLESLLNRKIGFMLGDSLRRQLHAILAETILQLQDEGLLYAIYEKRQHCYHVTIRKP